MNQLLIIIIIIALWCKHTKGLLVTCTNSRESNESILSRPMHFSVCIDTSLGADRYG